MQSVSDDDVRKRLLQKPRFELTAKGVFRLGKCYILRQGIPGFWASNRESTAADRWSLDRGTRRQLVPVEWRDHMSGRLHTGTGGPRYTGALQWRTLNVSSGIVYGIQSAPKRTTSEEWPVCPWCGRWRDDFLVKCGCIVDIEACLGPSMLFYILVLSTQIMKTKNITCQSPWTKLCSTVNKY